MPEGPPITVVNVIAFGAQAVGGIMTWALRFPGAISAFAPRYRVHTIALAMTPGDEPSWVEPELRAAGAEIVRRRRDDEPVTLLERLTDAISARRPGVVIANYLSMSFMAAGLAARACGARIVVTARNDDDDTRALLRHYHAWDGGLAVSAACAAWLDALANGRPTAMTPSGAPVAAQPRHAKREGPLRLAFVGRVEHRQKRVLDLVTIARVVRDAGHDCLVHVIGDGDDAPALARAAAEQGLSDRFVMHGACPPSRLEALWPSMDVCVLPSAWEGTSVSMLEAMGQGVVPAVTDVSGAREWVRDGESGVIGPVGDPEVLGRRIGALAADRATLERMGRAAWTRACAAGGLASMARTYADLFDRVLARPAARAPSDCWLQPTMPGWWEEPWTNTPMHADAFVRRALTACGYARIALGRPEPECDAVLVGCVDTPPSGEEINAWRARGLGVAISPSLRIDTPVMAVRRAIMRLRAAGFARIALYGAGAHTRKVSAVAHMGLPLVGVIDDAARPGQQWQGLPVVRPSDALRTVRPDAVVLSSDTVERRLWTASEPLRRAGVRVEPVYGRYDDAPCEAVPA